MLKFILTWFAISSVAILLSFAFQQPNLSLLVRVLHFFFLGIVAALFFPKRKFIASALVSSSTVILVTLLSVGHLFFTRPTIDDILDRNPSVSEENAQEFITQSNESEREKLQQLISRTPLLVAINGIISLCGAGVYSIIPSRQLKKNK